MDGYEHAPNLLMLLDNSINYPIYLKKLQKGLTEVIQNVQAIGPE